MIRLPRPGDGVDSPDRERDSPDRELNNPDRELVERDDGNDDSERVDL